ncbi:hypothetical protein LTR86_010348 [Recurvomyces mirabilis]|nr:hypothetical protein LTR86_010348 [Recurvomyces mirabilis]
MAVSASISLVVIGLAGYLVLSITYRLLWHPLARFPGPKLAAATKWYEFYYEVLHGRGGQFWKVVDRMHDRYGAIVRITPEELHIRDSSQYDTVYTGKRDKSRSVARLGGQKVSTFATEESDLHRKRRAPNMLLFGKRTVDQATPMIRSKIEKLLTELQRAMRTGEVIDVNLVFLALTTDIAGYHVLHEELGMQDDLTGKALRWKKGVHQISTNVPLVKQYTWLADVIDLIPSGLWQSMAPDIACLIDLKMTVLKRAKVFLHQQRMISENGSSIEPTNEKVNTPKTLFEYIWTHPSTANERDLARLYDEGQNVMIAGSETSARILTRVIYELLTNTDELSRLHTELAEAQEQHSRCAQDLTWLELERLPWLTGIVKESLRIANIATSRLPVKPHESLRYLGWTIPAMTQVSLSPYDVMRDENIFPQPDAFKPERWLTKEHNGTWSTHNRLDKYLVAFGKGARMCQGINLAYAELYMTVASVFSRFKLELFDVVKERDITTVADYFLAEARADSKGVRMKVLSEIS